MTLDATWPIDKSNRQPIKVHGLFHSHGGEGGWGEGVKILDLDDTCKPCIGTGRDRKAKVTLKSLQDNQSMYKGDS